MFCLLDCCDGSDEYDGSISCPNTCVMGGHTEHKTLIYGSRVKIFGSRGTKQKRVGFSGEDTIQKLQGNTRIMSNIYTWLLSSGHLPIIL